MQPYLLTHIYLLHYISISLGQCEQPPSTLRENRGHEHDLLEILDNFLTSNADEDEEDESETFGSAQMDDVNSNNNASLNRIPSIRLV